jgi:hypothetical protein
MLTTFANRLKAKSDERKVASKQEDMLNWIKGVQKAATPLALHNLVIDRATGYINILKELCHPLVRHILLCTLAIRIWELHGQYLDRCFSYYKKICFAGTYEQAKQVQEELENDFAPDWLYKDVRAVHDTPFLVVLESCLSEYLGTDGYRRYEHLWSWSHPKVRDDARNLLMWLSGTYHAVLASWSKGEHPFTDEVIRKRKTTSKQALEHYKAVYKRLLAEGKDLPDVQCLPKALPAQQANRQTSSGASPARPGSSSSQR